MKRTPDVRTLPILPRWAAEVRIEYVSSLIKHESLINLFANAGVIIGVGDGRPEKGKLDYGCWRICTDDDPEFLDIVKTGGRKAQDEALASPKYHDVETERLLEWFSREVTQRGARPAKDEVRTTRASRRDNGGARITAS